MLSAAQHIPIKTKVKSWISHKWSENEFQGANPANSDPWFHMFCKWIHEFNWLNLCVSVHEFTRFCEQIWCVDTRLPWKHEFFTQWHVPVKLYQFWPNTTHVKLVTTARQNTCIHVNTQENTYWWSGTNYEPTGSEMVPCLLGIDTHTCRS